MSKITKAVIGGLAINLMFWGGMVVRNNMTIFVIPPLNALPEGKTVILWGPKQVDFTVWRMGGRGFFPFHESKGHTLLRFIDNADAICTRDVEPTVLCRAAVLGAFADNATIVARLPYNETLYMAAAEAK